MRSGKADSFVPQNNKKCDILQQRISYSAILINISKFLPFKQQNYSTVRTIYLGHFKISWLLSGLIEKLRSLYYVHRPFRFY